MFHYRRRSRVTVIALWLIAPLVVRASDADSRRHSRNAALFSEATYKKNVTYLASDELEGRGTGQEGIDKAADYIAAWFKKCGVEPGGDKGTYFQNFTLKLKNRIASGTKLTIGVNGRTTRMPAKLHDEFVPFPFSKNGTFRGPVVFAGYGLVDDERHYNDYDGIDVAGKVVLVLRRAPKFADFTDAEKSFRAKASRASAHDAAALLIVNPADDEDGDKLFSFDESAGAGFGFGGGSYGIPMVHIRRAVAERMLKAGGLADLATLQQRIEKRKQPVSAPLEGVSVRGRVNIEPVESPVRNIVGIIPGKGPQSDEMIVLGAHYDHLGIRHKGEDSFNPVKDISNGADDNASGTSLVMTLADAYTHGQRPNRSLLLILFTGEERGLLGSAHFASHPTIDLKKCVAMFNFDMVGRLKDDKLEIGGMRTGDFTDIIERLAQPYGLKIKDGGGGTGPSDHTNFYNKGIPILFFFTGLHKQYHQPEDDTPLLNIEGAVRIAKFAADCIDEIDAKSEPPEFAKDSRSEKITYQDQEDDDEPAAPRPGRGRVRLGIKPSEDDSEPGVLVAEVVDESPAQSAGVQEGDRIIKIDDDAIKSGADLIAKLGKFHRDDKAKLTVRRDGKSVVLDVAFGRRGVRDRGSDGDDARKALTAYAKRFENENKKAKVRIEAEKGPFQITLGGLDRSMLSRAVDEVMTVLEKNNATGAYSLMLSSQSADRYVIVIRLTDDSAKGERPQDRTSKPVKKEKPKQNPHADAGENSDRNTMPGVRLGIMPTYGEATDEGYEISGVVDGGPAAKAGMKDGDRIWTIGDARIKDVYTYMDALRKFKPGDSVKVVILRDGKKITITIKTVAQKSREAA
jgi:type II secretory pathway component PulC